VRTDEIAHYVVDRGADDGVVDVVLQCGVRRNHANERERWRQHTERQSKWCTHREQEPCRQGPTRAELVVKLVGRSRGLTASALSLALIHRSAWKGNSPKFACTIVHKSVPGCPRKSGISAPLARGRPRHLAFPNKDAKSCMRSGGSPRWRTRPRADFCRGKYPCGSRGV
jgi:hypothetical protein